MFKRIWNWFNKPSDNLMDRLEDTLAAEIEEEFSADIIEFPKKELTSLEEAVKDYREHLDVRRSNGFTKARKGEMASIADYWKVELSDLQKAWRSTK